MKINILSYCPPYSHKLCTSLMKAALSSTHCDLQLFTWTPVNSIDRSGRKGGGYVVKTAKGDIKASRVVLCTNAHTKNFFPASDPLHTQLVSSSSAYLPK
jgi:glycine/D-amino acid oxidase-like deaminating enzyme